MSLKDRFIIDGATLTLENDMPQTQLGGANAVDSTVDLKEKLRTAISQKVQDATDWLKLSIVEQKRFVRKIIENKLEEDFSSLVLTDDEKEEFAKEFSKETVFGPLGVLYRDSSISEIFVNGAKNVYVEKNGKPYKTSIVFNDNDHLKKTIEAIVSIAGRKINEKTPSAFVRLPDGSRVSAIVAPLGANGATLTIKRYSLDYTTMENLMVQGSLTTEMARFLEGALRAGANILITGKQNSGKTSLLNALIGLIPQSERSCTIEKALELNVPQAHIMRLETGFDETKNYIQQAINLRPVRLVLGEIENLNAKDFVCQLNSGFSGSLATIRAKSATDALLRLEEMTPDLVNSKNNIARAFDMVIEVEKLTDGTRKIVKVSEVLGADENGFILKDIFHWQKTGEGVNTVLGMHTSCAYVPKFLEKIVEKGMEINSKIFEVKYEHTYLVKPKTQVENAQAETQAPPEKKLTLNIDLLKKLKK